MQTCCPIVELRQYTLHPGKRDDLIALFDREFVESQEAHGAKIIGQFRDAGDPDRFVWLRGFADMESRENALRAFYGGPVWKVHREAANATMVDSDNVLLLRPARTNSGFHLDRVERAPTGAKAAAHRPVFATMYFFDDAVPEKFVDNFEEAVVSASAQSGTPVLAYFVTESAPNNFPALPIREGENVFVCFSAAEIGEIDTRWKRRSTEILRLEPTARSLVR
ncbi:MAG TPA: NIPSNAP family protein [Candidatus Eremiobacteraceae bacterium]|nr:NIPSNAP family protein [Candidatus Eremiobacteraceae bacterium]